jgi:hypothetical protein
LVTLSSFVVDADLPDLPADLPDLPVLVRVRGLLVRGFLWRTAWVLVTATKVQEPYAVADVFAADLAHVFGPLLLIKEIVWHRLSWRRNCITFAARILRHVECEPQEGAAFAFVFSPCDDAGCRYLRGVMKGVAFGVLGHTCDATFESATEFLLFRLFPSGQRIEATRKHRLLAFHTTQPIPQTD